ncbi:MAG TPA: chromosomal replication initiator protein DnaA [Acidimicrobiales bacterium]|nr:chromosomal replication initiator protein DnaA [Acidimicrobiales bacterium]
MDVIVDSSSGREALRQVDDAEILWTACAGMLREQVSEAVWQTTFAGARGLRTDAHVFVLAVPSSVVRERIEGRYLTLVESSLADVGGGSRQLLIEVHTTANDGDLGADATLDADLALMGGRDLDVVGNGNGDHPVTTSVTQSVNPRYTFDAFVTGTSNRFAHAAALSVAETPARSYNPLFIYGGAGLGKTHLLQAIAHYVSENYPASTVRYVSTETFMNQFVDAIRTNSPAEFKKRYREVDVLLLDDIQFLEGREGLQEELFHTFNALHQSNHQIVLSSDRPPDAIPTLEDRLRSRFKMGLITEINPPDLETRLAILHKKAETEPISPPPDVLEFIATHITNNIRELEGALIRVCAYASLTKEELSVELAERVLADILNDSQPRPITPQLILQKTSEMFGFSIDEIRGKSRRRPLVTARQVGMYVFREQTDLSYPAIAREFGGRDHTTVIHAVEKIGALMKERRQIYDQVTELTQNIRSGG